jgi:hypothetical protein
MHMMRAAKDAAAPPVPLKVPGPLGVAIEARYTVGEYGILILSAREKQDSRPGCATTAIGFLPARCRPNHVHS